MANSVCIVYCMSDCVSTNLHQYCMGRRLHPCCGSQEALIAASHMPRPSLLRRLVPSSLAGQIILFVAISLFLAQAINFTLLLRERERQRLTVATAPAVARIIDALEDRKSGV